MAPDAAKISAFKSYDFDSSEEFTKHLHNVELPAGSAAATALLKVKAKWYEKNVDPDFDPAWVSSQSSGQSYTSNTSSSNGSQQQSSSQQQSGTGATPRPSGGATRAGAAGQPFPRQLQLALLQLVVLVLVLLYLQPANAALSNWAYYRLTMTLMISQSLKVLSAHGWPGFNVAALRAWAGRIAKTSDGHYFLLAAAAAINSPFTYILTPFVVLAVYQFMFFLSEHYSSHPLYQKYGDQAYRWLIAKQQHALLINAQAEIMSGVVLMLGLILPSRKFFLTLAVWQILRLRYWSTDAAIHHRRIWQMLDQQTIAFRHKFPFLQKVVDVGRGFFEQGRVPAQ